MAATRAKLTSNAAVYCACAPKPQDQASPSSLLNCASSSQICRVEGRPEGSAWMQDMMSAATSAGQSDSLQQGGKRGEKGPGKSGLVGNAC